MKFSIIILRCSKNLNFCERRMCTCFTQARAFFLTIKIADYAPHIWEVALLEVPQFFLFTGGGWEISKKNVAALLSHIKGSLADILLSATLAKSS